MLIKSKILSVGLLYWYECLNKVFVTVYPILLTFQTLIYSVTQLKGNEVQSCMILIQLQSKNNADEGFTLLSLQTLFPSLSLERKMY